MSEHEPEVDPGGEPPADDRNEEMPESPVPDPEAKNTSAEDDPEAD